ncbi:MAG: ABC transporter permease, partial [Pirellulaceae bacterium]|nr:ABC transporter permease [Pirellulaceae bacterium]
FVAIQTWGYSMLEPFVPGDWSPDALVCITEGGLPDEAVAEVARLDGIRPSRCLPVAVEQPKLAEDITGSSERQSVARQDTVVMMGVEPEAALAGSDPVLNLGFVEGSRDEAIEAMRTRRGCIVPDHFARTAGLAIGDSFRVLSPEAPDTPVEYTVAGVVTLPGWHWMSKFSGVRRRDARAAATIFASRDDVRRDFGLEKTNFIWFDLDEGADLDQVGEAIAPIAERFPGEKQPVNQQGKWDFAARMYGRMVRITTPEMATERIDSRADSMIWSMCHLPLITLLVTSLGVVNAVLASVRARRWEMGVLRAVGVTRFGLARMVLAESILIGLVACVLSLGFGLTAGWCGMGVSQYVSFFGGLAPSLVVPWKSLAIGVGATVSLCLLAGLWPAISTGRAETLRLLQVGRSAM